MPDDQLRALHPSRGQIGPQLTQDVAGTIGAQQLRTKLNRTRSTPVAARAKFNASGELRE